jgi:hypothetical protein
MKRTVKSCGPDALVVGVLSQNARASCEGGDKQAQSRRGEHEVSRNPSRRESRIAPVTPVVLPPSFLPFARGPWVRSAPGFPCALCSRRAERRAKLGRFMSRECGAMTHRPRHSLSVVLEDSWIATPPPQCGRDISATTAERVSTPSFSKICIRCVFTVARPMLRHSPISRLVRPQHNSSTTSISREVSP